MIKRPETISEHHPDTRETCPDCKGEEPTPPMGYMGDDYLCPTCRGMGYTGHHAHIHSSPPSAADWEKYANELEREVEAWKERHAALDRFSANRILDLNAEVEELREDNRNLKQQLLATSAMKQPEPPA